MSRKLEECYTWRIYLGKDRERGGRRFMKEMKGKHKYKKKNENEESRVEGEWTSKRKKKKGCKMKNK